MKKMKRTIKKGIVAILALSMALSNNIVASANATYQEVYEVTEEAIVTKDNFFDYFDEDGTIKENAPGTISFSGSFADLGINKITLNKEVMILTTDASFNDVQLVISGKNIIIHGITINISKTSGIESAISISDSTNVMLIRS